MYYSLLDSGNQKKLEKFGKYRLIRPCSQALWKPQQDEPFWQQADGYFTRENGNRWILNKSLPSSWIIEHSGLRFKVSATDFGHLGIFPEHSALWTWAVQKIKEQTFSSSILNLFAYSGGATLACAAQGAQVCHLDASKATVQWARENAEINQLQKAPIRWIVEDVIKFLKREYNRKRFYDGIILDPPSFGRGNKGEVFKIERDLYEILQLCRSLLSERPLFVILSTHTLGITPIVLKHLLEEMMHGISGNIEMGEMILSSPKARAIPSGSFARWSIEK